MEQLYTIGAPPPYVMPYAQLVPYNGPPVLPLSYQGLFVPLGGIPYGYQWPMVTGTYGVITPPFIGYPPIPQQQVDMYTYLLSAAQVVANTDAASPPESDSTPSHSPLSDIESDSSSTASSHELNLAGLTLSSPEPSPAGMSSPPDSGFEQFTTQASFVYPECWSESQYSLPHISMDPFVNPQAYSGESEFLQSFLPQLDHQVFPMEPLSYAMSDTMTASPPMPWVTSLQDSGLPPRRPKQEKNKSQRNATGVVSMTGPVEHPQTLQPTMEEQPYSNYEQVDYASQYPQGRAQFGYAGAYYKTMPLTKRGIQVPVKPRTTKRKICRFCLSNKETAACFKSHVLFDKNGKVSCPVLRKLVCSICDKTGDDAHTFRYCPFNRQCAPASSKGESVYQGSRVCKNAAGDLIFLKF